jgi:hypothetical protein
MRSDSKIPAIWTIVNNREYIWWLESRYPWWHKRNYITVKCLKCWLESHIESKWFWKYGCKCVRLEEKKWTKHWFQSKDNKPIKRFYMIYNGLKTRCKGTAWWDASKWYHDKGIKCEWETFEQFRDDMYESYVDHVKEYWEKNTTIDRINPNWNYCKKNCRWATYEEQNYNKWITNFVEIDWIKYNWKMLAERCKISKSIANDRISKYLHWRLKYSNLILEWCHRKDPLEVIIDWKTYKSKDIESITWINPRNSRKRLRDYIDWKITKEKLFAPKSRWI